MNGKFRAILVIVVVLVSAGLIFVIRDCSNVGQLSDGDFDLVAVAVRYQPNPIHVGDKVVFEHVIRNDGTDRVPGRKYDVDFLLDGRNDIFFDHATSELQPGMNFPYGMAPGFFHWQPTNAGRYHYRFVIDSHNTVRERTETNNVLEGYIQVLP